MFAKPKRKQGFWWDSLFFPQDFKMMVDTTPQECVNHLLSLKQPYSGFWYPYSQDVWTEAIDGTTYDFEICFNRYGRGMTYASVKCKGSIFRDSWSEKTVITGRFINGVLLILLWASLIMILLASLSGPSLGWIAIIIAVGLIYGLQSWADRRRLRSLVFEALQAS